MARSPRRAAPPADRGRRESLALRRRCAPACLGAARIRRAAVISSRAASPRVKPADQPTYFYAFFRTHRRQSCALYVRAGGPALRGRSALRTRSSRRSTASRGGSTERFKPSSSPTTASRMPSTIDARRPHRRRDARRAVRLRRRSTMSSTRPLVSAARAKTYAAFRPSIRPKRSMRRSTVSAIRRR